ncbi:hypothetical protein BDB00DRAFT_814098 [Zychaea mexicana]|uniref:uncharacterized protein n=1 Tax=Zychaea mexicana TaxID=64656 RepID=UPI0022FF398F|nr:uncharacterized protein BDB00DRAFT_814098 [Zychaea mexicana]KAI9495311.1 hypothetical protein BDB00DRAFT_814098 [Zychaea mexicana]
MPFRVVATRILPPQTQARLEDQNYDLVQWKEDTVMPRDELLKQVKGIGSRHSHALHLLS